MFRDGNTIYYTDGYGGCHTKESQRPLKSAEEIEKIRHEMFLIQLSLRNSKNLHATDAQIAAKQNRLKQLERKIFDLSQPQCHKIKKRYKKLPPEKIKAFVLKKIDEAKAHGAWFITVEDIAAQLQVKPHFVKQVFQKLNVEGVLHQASHHIPHDSNRDPMCNGTYSGWLANIYSFVEKDDEQA